MLKVNSTVKLEREQIKGLAPSIFQTKGSSKTSDKYVHIPTSRVIDDMEQLGWDVVDVKEVKARKDGRIGFQKHLLIFRNKDIIIEGDGGDDVIPQILITNSHDGSSCFEFRAGIFRLICENGLVVATKEFEKMKIRHMGYSFEEVQEVMNKMLEQLPLTVETMNKMKGIKLDENQSIELASRMVKSRFEEEDIKELNIDLEQLLTPSRVEDTSNDMFTVMNVLQEKILGGDFMYTTKSKARKARKIKNFQQDVKINQRIFSTAFDYMNLISA
jgi:hypothetical protein